MPGVFWGVEGVGADKMMIFCDLGTHSRIPIVLENYYERIVPLQICRHNQIRSDIFFFWGGDIPYFC